MNTDLPHGNLRPSVFICGCLSDRTVEPLDQTCIVIRVNERPFVVQTFLLSGAPRGRLGRPSIADAGGIPWQCGEPIDALQIRWLVIRPLQHHPPDRGERSRLRH